MKRAFTLIELTIVLVIIALVTHLAVRELASVTEAKRDDAADRQLVTLREAVYEARPGDDPVGFLADMGRLPRARVETNEYREIVRTLRELWTRPDDVRTYAVRPATADNLQVESARKTDLADPDVLVPTGWRGPYLRLPFAHDRLLDPWGNPMENPDSSGLMRLTLTNGLITAVTHYGRTAQPSGRRTCTLEPEGGAASRLIVSAESVSGALAAGTRVTYRWYGPAAGLITGAVETVDFPAQAIFEGLTPGVRILKDSVSGLARRIVIRPGDNLIQIRLP